MFFVIDGIDGSGKGTQLELVKKELEKMGKTVKVFDYPRYGLPLSHYVEKYLNGGYGQVSAKLGSLFYALDRFDESEEIKKSIKEYDYVIANRYVSSNIIHQASKIETEDEFDEFIDWLNDLEFGICSIPKPDKTIFLSVAPDVSKELIKTKEKREYIKGDVNEDLHEKDKNHLIKAFEKAQKASKKLGWDKIECLDENLKIRSREDIKNEILKKVI